MPHKRVLFRSVAREKLLRGAGQLADAVRVTLGPKSKSVLIQKKWGVPLVCNDGVTIAKEFDLEDAEENLGAQMLRQAAEKTGEAVGDGTSTSVLLAHAMFGDGVRNVVAGASAIDLKRGLERAAKATVDQLKALSRPVKERKEKAQVATISAHNDPVIGELVAEAMEKVGNEGVITVEELKTTETTLDVVEGMQFDRGFISPYFITNTDKMEAVLEDALILICDRKISALKDLIPLLEQVAKAARPLLRVGRGCRGRGACHTHRQSAAGHPQELRCQGAGVWRSPQGHAGGHRRAHRRTSDLGGTRPQARERDLRSARASQAHRRRQGQYHHHRRQRQPQGH